MRRGRERDGWPHTQCTSASSSRALCMCGGGGGGGGGRREIVNSDWQ